MTLKKLALAISLTFMLTIAYQVLASYMTSPEGLNYPNPGHYPGEIGPGTFNCSGNPNCFWSFPDKVSIYKSPGVSALEIYNSVLGTKSMDVVGGGAIRQYDIGGQLKNIINPLGDSYITAGNLGVGTQNPQTKLDVNGSIRISDSGTTNPGTIRWTGNDFEGYNGSSWVSLTSGGVTGGEINFDIWSNSCSNTCSSRGCVASCSVTVPEGYTVLYAHKGEGYSDSSISADKCRYPSFIWPYSSYTGWGQCVETNIGDVAPSGGLTITAYIDAPDGTVGGKYQDNAAVGLYVIAIKANLI